MPTPDSTAWELLEAAAAGSRPDRAAFVERYEPMVRSWLGARWKSARFKGDVDDVVQEVFLQCFKPDGVLDTALGSEVDSFRAFLIGTVRHLAMRQEAKLGRRGRLVPIADADLDQQPVQATPLDRTLDRSWARSLLQEAAAHMGRRADGLGDSARLRVDILRLRFQQDLSIAEIARQLDRPPSWVHHQYSKARREFRRALEEVLRVRAPGRQEDLLATCRWLMELLG